MKNLANLATVASAIAGKYGIDLRRLEKAVHMVQLDHVHCLPNGNCQVESDADPGHFYQVNLEHGTRCNCPDYAKRAVNPDFMCKHIAAVLIWNELPDLVKTARAVDVLDAELRRLGLMPA